MEMTAYETGAPCWVDLMTTDRDKVQDLTERAGTWFGLDDAIRSGSSLLYRVAPVVAFGFGKGESFSQTRYRFP